MHRKNSTYYFTATKRHFQEGKVQLHKFYGLHLSKAIELLAELPMTRSYFPFRDEHDFQYGIDGLCKLLEKLPAHITDVSFNVRYLLRLEEKDWLALVKAVPEHLRSLKLEFVNGHEEYPHLDLYGNGEEYETPNTQQLKMLIETMKQLLKSNVNLSYDFKAYGIEKKASGILTSSSAHKFFGGGEGVEGDVAPSEVKFKI